MISAQPVRIAVLALWLLTLVCPLTAEEVPAPPVQSPQGEVVDDDSPRLDEFPKELLHSFGGLWSRDNLPALVVGVAATSAVVSADSRVAGYFEDTSRFRNFDAAGKQFGAAYVLGSAIGISLVASRATGNKRFRQASYSLAQGFVVNSAVTGGIKELTRRERPDRSNRLAFPSGHTSSSVMWATVVSHYYGKRAGIPAYVVAAYVGASRLKSRKHYLTDVIAGAAVGYMVGKSVTRAQGRNRRFHWGVTVPPGGGLALNLQIRP